MIRRRQPWKWTKRRFVVFVILCLASSRSPNTAFGIDSTSTTRTTTKPNIVIMFADNLGYADIGLFGSPTARTPHVDSIGTDGMKLNNFNSIAHLCSASRATLLTGRYPIRTGIYPGVFKPDAVYGMLPNETTIAELLKDQGYATSIVGKWHLGHRPDYLPTNQGFDEWLGIPYHASGGSVDGHICQYDYNETMWLPLYDNQTIVEQPVRMYELAEKYAQRTKEFIVRNVQKQTPFFLYMAFSHVHQLCAPRDLPEQPYCQWSAKNRQGDSATTFVDAVEEMDWLAGQILSTLDEWNIRNDTIVLFTSDNGPWLAEQSCSGSRGPFQGQWLANHVDWNCTACPHDYISDPTIDRPRRCILNGTEFTVDGVHCGQDVGLGSIWEANIRMPAVVRWPNNIKANTETMTLVSTLDIVPTILSILHVPSTDPIYSTFDGIDISSVWLNNNDNTSATTMEGQAKELQQQQQEQQYKHRILFFWRDGFDDGPLGPPYGRYDVVAVKQGPYKVWYWTKSSHYNNDPSVYHDPPLLFNVLLDPAEAYPLNTSEYMDMITQINQQIQYHKDSVDWTFPLTLAHDAQYIPCVDHTKQCRTDSNMVLQKSEEDSF